MVDIIIGSPPFLLQYKDIQINLTTKKIVKKNCQKKYNVIEC